MWRIDEAVHVREYDHDAVISVSREIQIVEVVVVAAVLKAVDAAEHSVELIIDAFLTVWTDEVVRADLAVEIHSERGVARGIVEAELVGRCGRKPDVNF